MALEAVQPSRFTRKTELGASEYHKNFYKLDLEVIAAVTSPEADKVTPLMSKIYLRLVSAPPKFYERDRVLRFEAELREGRRLTAWELLCEVLGVASATARKAIAWLHEAGVIGYYAGKNGAGIRVFVNRANSSIGSHPGAKRQKILRVAHTSLSAADTSPSEVAFKDSFAVSETLDSDVNSPAPKNGATHGPENKSDSSPSQTLHPIREKSVGREVLLEPRPAPNISVEEIVTRIKAELEPALRSVAANAAAQATRGEIERTRTWFETRALPKAVRVAQSECYQILKKGGSLEEKSRRARADLDVGRRGAAPPPEEVRPRTHEEINEIAETCLALLQAQGQSVEVTLAEISAEAGGWLLPEDAPKVRATAERMLAEVERRG
ncbi:MAG TPA: hypothetical protein VF591_18325 [Pyrinomonadaceae bacterium]|jgi:hypothetical protein